MLGTKAFVAAVMGGIGSIPEPSSENLVVGFVEVAVATWPLSVWQDAVVFLPCVVLVKPTGLLGHAVYRKFRKVVS